MPTVNPQVTSRSCRCKRRMYTDFATLPQDCVGQQTIQPNPAATAQRAANPALYFNAICGTIHRHRFATRGRVVTFGLEHRGLGKIDAVGVDEIQLQTP